jgi:hypothetical protein
MGFLAIFAEISSKFMLPNKPIVQAGGVEGSKIF